jgi:two-component system sensor histidine kinase/response regulator
MSTHQETILVAEDEPNMLEMIAYLLEDEGYVVIQAASGEAVLDILEEAKPDLIISDINMPGMDGFELCQRVRAQVEFSQTPFIFLSARSRRADVRRGMGLGADDYLTKPFEAEELLAAVQIRLARAAEAKSAIHRASADLQKKIIQALIHEFRTPLALVVGYVDLLETAGHELKEDDFQTILHGLHSGSDRLKKLVEDFLLLSRLRTGDLARELSQNPRETHDPDRVIESVAAEALPLATLRHVSFTLDMDTPGVTLAVAHEDLAEIADRLVDNAIKFSKSGGGAVVITTRCKGNQWVMEVTDNGVGIRQEALAWIFEAFHQVDRDKMEQQGSGVGLTIVRGLSEVYGGGVSVESTPGVGSTFVVWLPLASDWMDSGAKAPNGRSLSPS